ncbi:SRPBCC domain-containing protein [Mucilaginibacter sp. JRF]|uniref:SRPBCC family protein n=1 Tax=Mucilaginibacter sp. JRF TaxID=2780088 RepID=UPI00187FDE53|nr:SRPBCC domain-containing protein [Mucilaginibacter sp. JRF]MBE9584676.1 SRPBCC domain-containing protein [Mucilaginibacter sp. JRF]
MTTQSLVLTRTLNAPVALVFKAWTDREALAQWWGPQGSTVTVKEFNLTPGGLFHYHLSSQHGEMWALFKFREIEAPGKLVFVSSFSDEDGNLTRGPFFPNWPLEILNILTLEEADGKTLLTLTAEPINATADETKVFTDLHPSMQQGYAGTFIQLENYLKNQ